MDASTVQQLISNLGFPIVACGALFWYMNRQEERHREEQEALRVSLEKNTDILTRLYERMGENE